MHYLMILIFDNLQLVFQIFIRNEYLIPTLFCYDLSYERYR
jgi:hypothetical protein